MSNKKTESGPQALQVAQELIDSGAEQMAAREYDAAAEAFARALEIRQDLLDPEDSAIAVCLNNLGAAHHEQGRLAEAEPFYQRALAVYEKAHGPDRPELTDSLSNLAKLYLDQDLPDLAAPLHERVLTIEENALNPDHSEFARHMNKLANKAYDFASAYEARGHNDMAEAFRERCEDLQAKAYGPEGGPPVGSELVARGDECAAAGRLEEAIPHFERALAIFERFYDWPNRHLTKTQEKLIRIFSRQKRYDRIVPIQERAIDQMEDDLGRDHPKVGDEVEYLGWLHMKLGNFETAVPLLERTVAMDGYPKSKLATVLTNLGVAYWEVDREDEAGPLFERALSMQKTALGAHHEDLVLPYKNVGEHWKRLGHFDKAETAYLGALDVAERTYGRNFIKLISLLRPLGEIHEAQGLLDKAMAVRQRTLTIAESKKGPDSVTTARCLDDLASLQSKLDRDDEAGRLFERALAIKEEALGSEDPQLETTLFGLAAIYVEQDRFDEAQALLARAEAIRTRAPDPGQT